MSRTDVEDILLKIDRILQPARRCAVILEDSVMNAVELQVTSDHNSKRWPQVSIGLARQRKREERTAIAHR